MKLVMTLKVRDEEDILEQNLRFHFALGVDHVIALDNKSTDRTPQILERYERAGLATVLHDDADDLRGNDSRWATEMARHAFEMGADWSFHNDADEFWWPLQGDLKQSLGAIPERFGAIVCPRSEYVGVRGGATSFADNLVVRESRSNLQPKMIHRARPDVVFFYSTQEATAAPDGDLLHALRPPGRAIIRAVRSREHEASATADPGLVWAPSWPVRIFHFPLRSLEQFECRARIGIEAGGWRNEGRVQRLREAYEGGRLEQFYDELIHDEARIAAGIEAGELVRDDRIARVLERCPDPLVEPGGVQIAPAAEELEREREEVAYDAMRLIGRTQQFANLQLERVRARSDEWRAKEERRRERKENRAALRAQRNPVARHVVRPIYRFLFRPESR